MNYRALSELLFSTSLLFWSAQATAQDASDDRFSLSLGVFVTDRESDIRLNGSNDGSLVNLEKDLGHDLSDTVFRLDGYYRFNERHRIDFSVFDLSRSASREIDREIVWGDSTFAIDTTLDSAVDFDIYKFAYTYSFLRRDKGYLGVTAGAYVADIRASLSERNLGQGTVSDVTAPLPVIGLRGEYALSDRWTLRASGEFFFVEYDDIDGSLVDLYAGIDYRVMDHLSLGFGINSVEIDVGVEKRDYVGGFDWQYVGGLAFLKFQF